MTNEWADVITSVQRRRGIRRREGLLGLGTSVSAIGRQLIMASRGRRSLIWTVDAGIEAALAQVKKPMSGIIVSRGES